MCTALLCCLKKGWGDEGQVCSALQKNIPWPQKWYEDKKDLGGVIGNIYTDVKKKEFHKKWKL